MSTTLDGKRVWVIGASSGIGAATAHELVKRGARVAISARREQELHEVAGSEMVVAVADVSDRESVDAAAATVRAALGGIDVVLINAGFWQQMDVTDWDRDLFARHVEVNLLGMNNCVGAVLPEMVSARSGTIVGVASVAGYRGLTGAEAYGATKAAQINMLEGMRVALDRKGVQVVTVCPGFVKTGLTESNSFPMPFLIEADEAAESICNGLERGQMEIVFPLPMAALMKVARVLPVRLWAKAFGRAAK
ncbi:SDR family NAD(P)-dependent oxidoreductase [Williamsia sp. 1135]|uniref:SDR family NAD(P)-dependent oxidoreductase n=1 Tax=Williamsia sp. 1135 TaxID=1889262 RepID=UPI000A114343|nr:SDR family NAD(P)-dependent oxidoreductase [Williamsia sp. 1135]ORM31880.1 short-chain dehydrogenase [Williamsia sp. 1135]